MCAPVSPPDISLWNITILAMSFSKDSNQCLTLTLNGGNDTDPAHLKKIVDLKVEGGVVIKKSATVLGNLYCGLFLSGKFDGELFTKQIQERELTEGIAVYGDLNCENKIRVNSIAPMSTDDVRIDSDLTVDGNVTADRLIAHELYFDKASLGPKTLNNLQYLTVIIDGKRCQIPVFTE